MRLLSKIRRTINPPYSGKDLLAILGVLVILVAIPFTIILSLQRPNTTTKAASLTVTLRPDGPGIATNWTRHGCLANWICVNEVNADEDATTVRSVAGGGDIYRLQEAGLPAGSTNISVTFWLRARDPNANDGLAVVISASKICPGRDFYPTPSYQNFKCTSVINPITGLAWQPADIDNLGAGPYSGGSNDILVTQVWVEVTYTPPSPPTPPTPPTPTPPPTTPPSSGGGKKSGGGTVVTLDSLQLEISVPYLVGNLKAKVDVGGVSKDIEITPANKNYTLDLKGSNLSLKKEYTLVVTSDKTLVRKVKFTPTTGSTSLNVGDLILGDINQDNTVDSIDQISLIDSIARQTSIGDLNADRVINSMDWSILLTNFGKKGD